ncbi:polyprenyl synthetase family protein, partial [Myxococcota bacterium]
FVPRCDARGTVTLEGAEYPVQGEGWYDHEFGGGSKDETSDDRRRDLEAAWTWLAAQLEDGREITAYEMVNPTTGKRIGARAVVVDRQGNRLAFSDLSLEPVGAWRSTRTFNDYPTRFKLTVPEPQINLEFEASFDDQELITLLSKPAFWEGRCCVQGSWGSTQVEGRAFLERSGFATIETLDEFFGAVGQEVRKSVRSVLPMQPSHERLRDLVASKEREHLMDGVDAEAFTNAMIKPVREIADRGGKSWRSYAALACCDVVGGDSRHYVQWLAMPELLHVGSLIVDDVEDGSDVRRGGPTCHLVYGVPIAINAGTAAYFMGHKLLTNGHLSEQDKLRVYDLYFEALRAGHAGQALDIHGLDEAMNVAIESGDGEGLEARVLAIHRLKTAVPAATLARMGAVAGNGTEEQIEALGTYFESVGLAFQIMDDVLNLRGFKRNLKTRGEDLSRGMVTLPVAKGVSRMGINRRRAFWAAVRAKPTNRNEVERLIADLEGCGAVEACAIQARKLVEDAWIHLDPLIEDSLPKLMLRSFGWYVLERTY